MRIELGVGLVTGLVSHSQSSSTASPRQHLTGSMLPKKDCRGGMVSKDIKNSIRNLHMFFGKNPKAGLEHVLSGTGKADLLMEHRHALGPKDTNVNLLEGRITVIMGLSGSGRSTLIRCLNRLIEATSGEVWVDGEDAPAFDEARLRKLSRDAMSMVFRSLPFCCTVSENGGTTLKVRGVAKRNHLGEAAKWLDRVGLHGYGDHYPHQLSGGMQQRTGIAGALTSSSPIILMDEAFPALDPLSRTDTQDLLQELQNELHKTIVFITHDLDEALRLADRRVILKDGHAVQRDELQQILLLPDDPCIEDFVSDINRARVHRARSIMIPLAGGSIPPDAHGRVNHDDTLKSMIARSGGETSHSHVVVRDGKAVGKLEMTSLAKALDPRVASEAGARKH